MEENKDSYSAAMLVVGNEILSGRTQDTNTTWIAVQLVGMGVILRQARVVQDIEADIVQAVNELRKTVDYVFVTGGIGPTHDDITAESIARAFGVALELNPEAYDRLVKHYGRKMAMIPAGARLIDNPVSGAPGFQIGNVFVMAGVPRIMHAMFDDVKTRLHQGKPVLSNTITCSLPESLVAEPLADIQSRYPAVSIGSYPHFRAGLLGLSLVVRGSDPEPVSQATKDVIDMVARLGGKPNAVSLQTY
jgi:molybdenum cofactor synthesis domain-containing protein